eukprot:INCI8220.1.p1 GENE.INCI8220.1~~INCI8220.1.p1  ORF type:complete len:521 (+),score=105.35 INCI8220.1:24-1565(+)
MQGGSASEGDAESNPEVAELADDAELLRKRLRSSTFRDACGRVGVKPKTLLPLTKSQLRARHPASVSSLELRLRHEALEKDRRKILCAVLAQEAESKRIARAREEAKSRQSKKLSQAFKEQMQLEEKILHRMAANRKKYEKVLEHENQNIVVGMIASSFKHDELESQRRRAADRMAAKAAEMAARKERRAIEAKERKLRLKEMQSTELREREERLRAKEEHLRAFHREKIKQREPALREKERRARERAEKLEHARLAQKELQQRLRNGIIRKSEQTEKSLANRAEEAVEGKIRRKIAAEARKKQAERTRESKAYTREQLAFNLEARQYEQAALAEMRHALLERRKQLAREEKIRRDRWRMHNEPERAIMPGPGEYELPGRKIKGGVWSTFKVKSDLDVKIELGSDTPAPGHYHGESFSTLDKTGGVMNRYKPKSDVEWRMFHAAQMPGPGEYNIEKALRRKSSAACISEFTPTSDLDRRIALGADTPAPGQNQRNNAPTRMPKFAEVKKKFAT